MSRTLQTVRNQGAVQTVSLPSSAPNTLVVDGNFLLKNAYHATLNSPEYIVNGRHIGVVYEFLRKIRDLVAKYNITKCVVFWDGEHGGKLRHNIYQYYKANRKNKEWYRGPSKSQAQADEDARSQRSIEAQKVRIQNYLENLFVRQSEQGMMEADDMIAYYCQQFHEQEQILIFSNDRDMCQLLALNGVNVHLHNLNLKLNRDNFDLHFDYHYSNAALYKILLGDTSDNIKGVKGLGDKTLYEYFPEIKQHTLTIADIKSRAHALCEERRLAKQKPLQVMLNILNGTAMRLLFGVEAPHDFGDELYEINRQLMDLSNPMLTREAREDVKMTGAMVLDPGKPHDKDGRNSTNILNMMHQDNLLRLFRGDLRYFAEPFFPLTAREIALFRANETI